MSVPGLKKALSTMAIKNKAELAILKAEEDIDNFVETLIVATKQKKIIWNEDGGTEWIIKCSLLKKSSRKFTLRFCYSAGSGDGFYINSRLAIFNRGGYETIIAEYCYSDPREGGRVVEGNPKLGSLFSAIENQNITNKEANV